MASVSEAIPLTRCHGERQRRHLPHPHAGDCHAPWRGSQRQCRVMASVSDAISLTHAGDCHALAGARNDNPSLSWRALAKPSPSPMREIATPPGRGSQRQPVVVMASVSEAISHHARCRGDHSPTRGKACYN
jgi:hypothetical protein